MSLLSVIGSAFWFILPAYAANAAPVVVGGGKPIDGGKKFIDGRPIFGGGKTWRGLAGGLVVGTAVGSIQGLIVATRPVQEVIDLVVTKPSDYLFLGSLLALGTLLGDLFGSFIKRRLGIKRGGPAPGLDQLDFVVGALLLASLIAFPNWGEVAAIITLTPTLHLGTNFVAYKLELKERPY